MTTKLKQAITALTADENYPTEEEWAEMLGRPTEEQLREANEAALQALRSQYGRTHHSMEESIQRGVAE